MRVPGAAGAVLGKDLGETRRVLRKVLERNRAVLHEGDGLSLLLHRHHDVEPRRAHLADGALQLRIEHLDHPARFRPALVPAETEIADELAQPQQPAKAFVRISFRKLDEQDGFGIAVHHRIDGGLEHGNIAREREHGAVHELDRDRTELHDVLRRIHGLREIAEMAGADGTAAEERRELELDLGGERERAFRSHEDVREVKLIAPGRERVEIVAADPALHLWKARLDLARLLRGQGAQRARDRH